MTDQSLSRFELAQEGLFCSVLTELRGGRKQGHWMWFIFPQIEGLGSSSAARLYAIRGLEEAHPYLSHPVLGSRLEEAVDAAMGCGSRNVTAIFGQPDNLKFRSSLTLFAVASAPDSIFHKALDHFFGGKPDPMTLHKLKIEWPAPLDARQGGCNGGGE